MAFRIKEDFLKNKKRLAIVVCIVVIIIIAIFGTSTVFPSFSSSEVTAAIGVDNTILRLGEAITFDGSNSKGDIKDYLWDLGDGNTSSNKSITHLYEFARWYNISLKVSNSDGESDRAQIVIGVQNANEHIEETFGRTYIIIQGGRLGRGPVIHGILPNIGMPTMRGTWWINGAYGSYTFEVLFFCEERVYSYLDEASTATREDLQFNLEITADEIPEDIRSVHATVWVERGGWSDGSFVFDVEYPFEDLAPP
jgi:hypothetical protein